MTPLEFPTKREILQERDYSVVAKNYYTLLCQISLIYNKILRLNISSNIYYFQTYSVKMCLSKFSNIDLLRQVALNLYSTEDNGDMNELCEKELSALINTYYQVSSILYNILIYISFLLHTTK